MLGPRAQAWLRARAASGGIALVLTDIDGVVTRGEGNAADVRVLEALAEHNRVAIEDPARPAVALCTGRQAPYVELMAQMTGAFVPCIFEHGAGMFFPEAFRFAFAVDDSGRLAQLRAAIDGPILRSGRAFVQPGKEASMTLYPLPGTSADELFALVAPLASGWDVERNVEHVEVRPPGITKGSGLRWLSELLDLPLSAFAGVGDSVSDLHFLRLVGFSAAPANASAPVRQAVEYVSPQPFGDGLLDIIKHVNDLSMPLRVWSEQTP